MQDSLYIGMMTGTSLDGLDAVLVDFSGSTPCTLAYVAIDYPVSLKHTMLALQAGSTGSGCNELHLSKVAGIDLAQLHATAVHQLLAKAQKAAQHIKAMGAHGQTVRHAPNAGQHSYTVQLLDAARLAEATGITVVTDFRSRDIAAGGQGAPLVPAFHAALCANLPKPVALCNIGGFANVTLLGADGSVAGFDTGPGNVLMDAWAQLYLGQPYDACGAWAASGQVNHELLTRLLAHPYFVQPLPKSTGREAFDLAWLQSQLAGHAALSPADVQASLCALTAHSIAAALAQVMPTATALYVCGGGAFNVTLMETMTSLLPCPVAVTDVLGIPAQQMEALAFAWLAQQAIQGVPANEPSVTGAGGRRVLGAIYPV